MDDYINLECFESPDIWEHADVVKRTDDGYEIHYNGMINQPYHWRIKYPDNRMEYFETENELWQFALKNKLFLKGESDGRSDSDLWEER
jgi:hypothetical protein